MKSRIRQQFSPAALTVSVIALILALTGGAFAANSNDGGASASAKKAQKGPRGPKGPKGDTGAQGPAGAPGKDGANGANGKDGSNGANGVSVTGVAATSGECPAGGVKYTSASGSNAICNGKNGADGEDGETGFTETLPPEKTETGMWAVGRKDENQIVPLSFNIPLAAAPTAINYVATDGKEIILGEGLEHVDPVHCLGSPQEPIAPAGEVCVYAAVEQVTFEPPFYFGGYIPNEVSGFGELFPSGASFFMNIKTGDRASGTWAVTAPGA